MATVKRCVTCGQAIPNPRRGRGRPTKLTRQLTAEFISHLENGNYPEDIAVAYGIDPGTYYRWMARGELDPEHPEFEPLFRDFRESVVRARARARLNYITKLAAAANENDVQAIKFYMERSDPDRWGRRDTLRIEQYVARDDLYGLFQELGEATRHAIEDGMELGRNAGEILTALAIAWQEIWSDRIESRTKGGGAGPALQLGKPNAGEEKLRDVS